MIKFKWQGIFWVKESMLLSKRLDIYLLQVIKDLSYVSHARAFQQCRGLSREAETFPPWINQHPQRWTCQMRRFKLYSPKATGNQQNKAVLIYQQTQNQKSLSNNRFFFFYCFVIRQYYSILQKRWLKELRKKNSFVQFTWDYGCGRNFSTTSKAREKKSLFCFLFFFFAELAETITLNQPSRSTTGCG